MRTLNSARANASPFPSVKYITPCNSSTVSDSATLRYVIARSKRVQNANACFLREFTGKIFAGKLLNWVGICCAMHFVLFAFFRPRIFHTSHLPRKCSANSWKLVTPWDAFSPSIQRGEMEIMGFLGIDHTDRIILNEKKVSYLLSLRNLIIGRVIILFTTCNNIIFHVACLFSLSSTTSRLTSARKFIETL